MTQPDRYDSFLALHQPGSPSRDHGTYGYTARARVGATAVREAFGK